MEAELPDSGYSFIPFVILTAITVWLYIRYGRKR